MNIQQSVCFSFFPAHITHAHTHTESPGTPFRILAHRAWTLSDFETREKWLRQGEWEDTASQLKSFVTGGDTL
jgi:hypothetical protein